MASRFFGSAYAKVQHLIAGHGLSGEIGDLRKDTEGAFLLQQGEASGTTAQRPAAPFPGQLYYDTTLGTTIVWNGVAWAAVAPSTSDYKESVRAATTMNLVATRTGNVLLADANGALAAQNGVALVVGDRFLVKNQGTGAAHTINAADESDVCWIAVG